MPQSLTRVAKVSKSLYNHSKPFTLVQNLYQLIACQFIKKIITIWASNLQS
jgi:hypothetical protein